MIAISLVLVAAQPLQPASADIAGSVTGTVFRDFNGDGDMDLTTSTGIATDVGVGGVVVEAYSDADVLIGTAATSATGTYTRWPTPVRAPHPRLRPTSSSPTSRPPG